MEESVSPTTTTVIMSSPSRNEEGSKLNWLGLTLVIIPLVTIIGNALVIVSVLRFRALHSAINFLILGLAVADLLVALFVMPYAVYTVVYNGEWFLGNLMCDLYMACDVACSTASILLLAVISFDRYRAVSRPIQYSRQSQNIQRVGVIIIVVWLISLTIASPMVFGVNLRPLENKQEIEHECRFYNAEFSIGSSLVSFVVPCFLVLFVYARIIVALKKREKAAKLRRLANAAACSPRDSPGDNNARRGGTSSDGDEAGRIVAGPEEHEFGGSSTPRSSIDSLSDNVHVVTNDFVSEGYTTQSRRCSSEIGENTIASSSISSEKSGRIMEKRKNKKFMHLRNSSRRRRRSFTFPAEHTDDPAAHTNHQRILPSILRQLSRRSPRLFRAATTNSRGAMIIENKETSKIDFSPEHERPLTALTETETLSTSLPRSEREGGTTVISNQNFSRSTTANSGELFDSGVCHDPRSSFILENNHVAEPECFDELDEESEQKDTVPTVTFSNTVHKMSVTSPREMLLKSDSEEKVKRRQSSAEEAVVAVKILTQSQLPGDESSNHRNASRTASNSTEGGHSLKKQLSKNGGLAVRLVKKTIKHEQSLKRKVSKNQRKEKRATKTLGIVVGIFLICWVPFFTMNILNAICILLDKTWCQVGFDAFFYSTWLGYMNSFMNPVIYTIFNTEFRRAFKSLIFGRQSGATGGIAARMGVRV